MRRFDDPALSRKALGTAAREVALEIRNRAH